MEARELLVRLGLFVLSGAVVTYLWIRSARGPRERHFLTRWVPLLMACVLGVVMAGYYLAWYVHLPIFACLALGIWRFNRKHASVHREDGLQQEQSR